MTVFSGHLSSPNLKVSLCDFERYDEQEEQVEEGQDGSLQRVDILYKNEGTTDQPRQIFRYVPLALE